MSSNRPAFRSIDTEPDDIPSAKRPKFSEPADPNAPHNESHESSVSGSEEAKKRRRENLAAWKSGLQMSLPAAPKKPVISFSLLGTKKPVESSAVKPKLELLDYNAAEARVSDSKDSLLGTTASGSSGMDVDYSLDELGDGGNSSSARFKPPQVGEVKVSAAIDQEPLKPTLNGTAPQDDDEEEDPLDSFMASIEPEVSRLKQESVDKAILVSKSSGGNQSAGEPSAGGGAKNVVAMDGEFDDEEKTKGGAEEDEEDDISKLAQVNVRKQLEAVNHQEIEYEPFRKEFYIEVPELAKMSEGEVMELRKTLDGVRTRGKACPKPIKTFAQSGLPGNILERLKRMKYERPTPIQAQALPAAMSGRDVIGIAKTGSGKTLAFLLPLLRHILAQRDLAPSDGPIGLVMVPTRELATQIHSDIKDFKAATGIISACIYGGAEMSAQIADLKRGAHIVVCTPGRMIEVLAMNKGRVTNLKRVTFLVIDEADRMFDLGFEQQIIKIVNNVRPDRQTVMFSATFPRQVEAAARKILAHSPLEITVHGRSVVADTITQIVEILDHAQKFYRLMELISEWYSKGSILVFAESQNAVDTLFHNVAKSGYDVLSFHSGRDQSDRDETIEKFKAGELRIMIATSGASRGLDVPGLKLVINYDVPNHLEDYVHRVGRTGRAGATGTAITFIAPDEEQYAGDILKAMKASNAKNIPEQLEKMAAAFDEKQKQGLARKHGSGFQGKGYQFSEDEEKKRKAAMNSVKLHFGGDLAEDALIKDEAEVDTGDSDDESEISRPASAMPTSEASSSAAAGGSSANAASVATEALVSEAELAKMTPQQRAAAEKFNELLISKAAQARAAASASGAAAGSSASSNVSGGRDANKPEQQQQQQQHFDDEIEINDFPQMVRKRVTSKETFVDLVELTGVAITPKGIYVLPGKPVPPGERKLYLSIEGPSQEAVTQARNGIRAVLETSMANFALRGDRPSGRYTVD